MINTVPSESFEIMIGINNLFLTKRQEVISDCKACSWRKELSNALRYSPEKGRIRIVLRMQKEDLILTVSDNGIGISKEDLPYIFERFYRGDSAAGQINRLMPD